MKLNEELEIFANKEPKSTSIVKLVVHSRKLRGCHFGRFCVADIDHLRFLEIGNEQFSDNHSIRRCIFLYWIFCDCEVQVIRQFREKVERIIRNLRRRHCEIPFVIFFLERSGSTHLCMLLTQHPQIVCRREDFSKIPISDSNFSLENNDTLVRYNSRHKRRLQAFNNVKIDLPTRNRVIQHLYDIYACPAKACGFKIKFPIQLELYPEVLRELKTIRNLRVISLKRRNVLKQAISRQNLSRIRGYMDGKSNLFDHTLPPDKEFGCPFRIDVQAVLGYAQSLWQQQACFSRLIADITNYRGLPTLNLEYEKLLADQNGVVRQVFEFLDVESTMKFKSALHKATPDALNIAIENFDELQTAVKGTDLEVFLDS